MVIGLARSGRTVPTGYYDNVVEYVKAKADANERLHRAKVTDNARVILALTAIGKDVIRMVPPLIITEEDVDKAVAIIADTIDSLSK